MRILHLIPGNLYGGVERFIAFLAARTDLAGDLAHHFAICFDGRLSRELHLSHARVHRLGAIRASRPWTVARGRRNLAALLDAEQFDVGVCHSSWPQAMFAPVLNRRAMPNVFYLHGPITRVSWVDRWAARTSPALMIAVSQHTLLTGRQIFPDVPARVLHYPLPIETKCLERSREGNVELIQISRMEALKGHLQLIDALAGLKDVSGWNLTIAGGAQRKHEKKYLRALHLRVAENGLSDRVNFIGERSDVPRLLARADVFCQANTGPEGFSVAFMEAFAAGLPIVTTAMGGAGELIDETCGVLCPPGDVAAISAAIRRLVVDRPLRQRLGAAGAARVRKLCDPQERLSQLRQTLASVAG